MTFENVEQLSINTIRFLSADAIEKANSGHPGLPLGAAPAGYVLFSKILKHNPKNPAWANRDRFVLSAGHGSMLLYSLLNLTGYSEPTIEDIKNFRQWNSKTPGHPENTVTPAIEVTTGPLGQGLANSVGLAAAERHLAARFNKPGLEIVDNYTYCLVGDGCLMEGISSEAASLAGHLGLEKLIVLYDDNHVTIDGSTDLAFSENIKGRFESFGWQVLEVADGDTDINAIEAALKDAKADKNRPSLIKIRTTIGYGCTAKQGSSDAHGAPLGKDNIIEMRKNLNWNFETFEIPEEVKSHMSKVADAGSKAEAKWTSLVNDYKSKYPEDYKNYINQLSDDLPEGWDSNLPKYSVDSKPMATRGQSGIVLNELAKHFKGLFGGSADLSPSNQTYIKSSGDFQKGSYENQNLRFGVREHAMGAICNGIALHKSGMIPYCATFLVFADYMRNAIRMSALSKAGVIYIFTHDSVAVGEDGPTHQPVEHVASLRLIPDLCVIRPADGNEVSGAYKIAIQNRHRPTVLILTRQNVPILQNSDADKVSKGGYIIKDCNGTPDIILIGTGSEVQLCIKAADKLVTEGINARVVSLPSWDIFESQSSEYKESVLPSSIDKRLSVEAGSRFGWNEYTGNKGDSISIDRFGASAPGDECLHNFGFTVENVLERAKKLLK
ncbi:MAG: transketolase [Deltaproteobacteria bacterium]|nr:transketolase [Deltaproteobacteria bacterium]